MSVNSRDEWRLVEPLFDQALELEPVQRDEFVRKVRRKSRRLAGKLVQLLEAADGATEVIIDRSLEDVASALIDNLPLDLTSGLEMGSLVGPYRLLEVLGAGGMGQVFRARGPDEETVAVKVLLVQGQQSDLAQRFEREQRILGALHHPNIAAVFDVGTSRQGFPYFALRLVDGPSIVDFCERQELNLRERVALLSAVCAPVQAAHDHGVVHRDLKPSNILVEGDRCDPQPIVLDFGVARDSLPMDITISGEIIGTPGYMAPEQARGDSRGVDLRSDVFSLGVLAYELIAGNNPFERESVIETLAAIIRDPVPELQSRDPEVEGRLSVIVQRCIEKDPDDRFSSVADLSSALDEWLR